MNDSIIIIIIIIIIIMILLKMRRSDVKVVLPWILARKASLLEIFSTYSKNIWAIFCESCW